MSNTAVELRPVAVPGRVGQATAVEQSRAVAEVQAAVIVAQQCPRSVQLAIEAMEEACRQIELAEVAFFRFPRADGVVEGPSVHLARELARCWGNIQYGVRELARDDTHRQSEMQAWAWDVQTNTRDSSDFIVPHQRDTKKGIKDLADLRDIYENNANNGARRLREMIFAMLPVWYRARAEKLCRQTIENGGGTPLPQRIADAVKAFERHRVSPARMAARFGHERIDQLTAVDVAQLGVIYSSIQQGTVTVDDEFPAEAARITPADLGTPKDPSPAETAPIPPTGQRSAGEVPTGAAPANATAEDSAGAAPAPGRTARPGKRPGSSAQPGERPPALIASGQLSQLREQYERLGYAHSDEDVLSWLAALARLLRLPGLASMQNLTQAQAKTAIDQLKPLKNAQELMWLLEDGVKPGGEAAQDAADGAVPGE